MAFLYSSLPALHCPALIAIAITAKNGDSIINANKDITRSAPRLKISYKFMVLSLIEKRHCVNTQIETPHRLYNPSHLPLNRRIAAFVPIPGQEKVTEQNLNIKKLRAYAKKVSWRFSSPQDAVFSLTLSMILSIMLLKVARFNAIR